MAGDIVQTLHILASLLKIITALTTDSSCCIIINWEKDKLEMSKYLSYLINILNGQRKHADLVLKNIEAQATNSIYSPETIKKL